MRKILLLILLLFTFTNIKAQGSFGEELVPIKSPQSHSFEKYGNVPVNMYTGSIDLKIPITSFDAGGMNVPVILSYDSSGFIPHKKSDPAGINWTLLAGGRITRQLNKVPDEYIALSPEKGGWGYKNDCSGFLAGVKANPSNNVNAYKVTGGTGFYNFTQWVFGPASNSYETHPDVFNFNALGISGKFMVGNDGNVLVESEDPGIKVDLSQMALYNYAECIPPASTIIITDGKGNRYFFGGDLSKYEISYSRVRSTSKEDNMPVINSFSLTKIILSTGSIIEFNYVTDSFPDLFCENASTIGTKQYPNGLLISMESSYQQDLSSGSLRTCPANQSGFLCGQSYSTLSSADTYYSFLKKSILSSIKFGDYEIRINYKDIGYAVKYESNSAPSIYNNDNEWVIDNVETYTGLDLLKKTTFIYSNLGGSNPRPFLTALKELDTNQQYSFEYYNTTSLPPYYTTGIDHWGYWNFKDNNISIAPFDSSYSISTGDYNLINTPRDPDPLAYNTALLSKITYPAKGYTSYEYEPHYYGKRVERNSASLFLPALTNNGGLAGGARIKKVINYSASGILSSQKEYQYVSGLNGNISSGILMNWPRYQYFFTQNTNGIVSTKLQVTSSNIQTTSLDSYNVGYSKVFEIEPGKGYTEYNFSTYETHPDTFASEISNTRLYLEGSVVSGSVSLNENDFAPINLFKNSKFQGSDKSILRGKLLTQKIFKQSDLSSPVKTVEYQYTDNVEFNPNNQIDNNKYVSVNQISGLRVQGYKKYMNASYLKKNITREFYSGNEIKTEQEYFYDAPSHLNVSRDSKSISNNIVELKRYKYANDYVFPPLSAIPAANEIHDLAALVSNNVINIPVEINNSIIKGGVEYVTGGKLNYFEDLKVEKTFELETNDLINVSGFNFSTVNPTVFVFDSRYKETATFPKYDSKGNILEIKPADGITTSYIWGYDNQYPIAKVINATYQDITNVLGTATLTQLNNGYKQVVVSPGPPQVIYKNIALTDAEIRTMLMVLQTSLTNAQVSIFTYKPLVGITSTTDVKGRNTYYEYDEFNRLKTEKDHNGKILSENEYHYKN